jgi:hypothetical protein
MNMFLLVFLTILVIICHRCTADDLIRFYRWAKEEIKKRLEKESSKAEE